MYITPQNEVIMSKTPHRGRLNTVTLQTKRDYLHTQLTYRNTKRIFDARQHLLFIVSRCKCVWTLNIAATALSINNITKLSYYYKFYWFTFLVRGPILRVVAPSGRGAHHKMFIFAQCCVAARQQRRYKHNIQKTLKWNILPYSAKFSLVYRAIYALRYTNLMGKL